MIIEQLDLKPNRTERLVLILGILLLLIPALISLFNMSPTQLFLGSGEALVKSRVGEITNPNRIVKKRALESSAYVSGRAGDSINMGDTIVTGKDSSTVITLDDGSVIQLGQDSLVKIQFTSKFSLAGPKKKVQVVVESGTAVVTASTAPIEVKLPTGQVIEEKPIAEVAKTEATPAPPLPKIAEFSLLSSDLKTIKPLNPAYSGIISGDFAYGSQNYLLKWESGGLSAVPPYEIKVRYKGQVESYSSKIPELKWQIPLIPAGKAEWWVEVPARNGGVLKSEPQTLSWILPAPNLGSPANESEIPESHIKGPTRQLLFTWKQMPICENYIFALSKTPGFSQMVTQQVTRNHYATHAVPKSGRLYWRVSCQYSKDLKLNSEVRSFDLGIKTP